MVALLTRVATDPAERSDSRRIALESLREIGPRAKAAIPALIAHLATDPIYTPRVLGHIGPKDPRVPPALLRLHDRRSHDSLVYAFGRLSADVAVPALIGALATRPRLACQALARHGTSAAPATAALAAMLDANHREHHQILRALAAIGPDAKAALPAVRRTLKRLGPTYEVERALTSLRR